MTPAQRPSPIRAFTRLCVLLLLVLVAPASAAADGLPDPMARGPYATSSFFQYKAGTVNLQEPNSTGTAPTGATAAATLQVRGSMYYPTDLGHAAPLIVFVHGNHGSCATDGTGGSAPNCTVFNRNDLGYSYIAENLATWGYAVASIDQDQLMFYQDNGAKGMHQRRLMIAAQLDALYAANQTAIPDDSDHNIGAALVGKLDFSRIGLMGHSRGGDVVSSYLEYNRTRPAPGRRYNITAVAAVAPVDYERRSPYGAAFLTILPACDGDVSNLQGARLYERGQRIVPGDPFPKIQQYVLGANHGNFNTVWSADADDAYSSDVACGATPADAATSIRLSGGTVLGGVISAGQKSGIIPTYDRPHAFSPDPQYMGDQEKIGLATMAAFFRRYVGGETAFDPYETGELAAADGNNQIPATACPTWSTATKLPCNEFVQTSYFAPAAERRDVIDPDPEHPLEESALGTAITASGFANPYTTNGGVSPLPTTTASGLDWCNPEPSQFTPVNLGITGYPAANGHARCRRPRRSAARLPGARTRRSTSPTVSSWPWRGTTRWSPLGNPRRSRPACPPPRAT